MLNISKIVGKFLKNSNQRELDQLNLLVRKINNLESEIKKIPDESFPAKTAEFKSKVKNEEDLEKLIPETFAYVREAARRVLGERHYDVQIMGRYYSSPR